MNTEPVLRSYTLTLSQEDVDAIRYALADAIYTPGQEPAITARFQATYQRFNDAMWAQRGIE